MKTPKSSPSLEFPSSPGGSANSLNADRQFASSAWSTLAQTVGLTATDPVLVALSGGADSVLLLRLLAAGGAPRPSIAALHFDHGLRGHESEGDAEFCRQLCANLGIPLQIVRAEIDTHKPGLEERARRARYRALCTEASRLGFNTIATGHHGDDRLETFLQRFVRGDVLSGMTGPQPCLALAPGSELNPTLNVLSVVRPMLALNREQILALLRENQFDWREDSSNQDLSFTRNRIRKGLVPAILEIGGIAAIDDLRRLEQTVRTGESAIEQRISHLAWAAPAFALAVGARPNQSRFLPRSKLLEISRTLRRRALWKLLSTATERGPNRRLLERLLDDLEAGKRVRHQLGGGWSLHLRANDLVLSPPVTKRAAECSPTTTSSTLSVPGSLTLADGRRITAQMTLEQNETSYSRNSNQVELDGTSIGDELLVRFPRPGDRCFPLGAPGSRRLCRFLADSGVPRDERDQVPLVFYGDELLWIAGVRPTEPRRIRVSTTRRLCLSLELAISAGNTEVMTSL
ncbi:MAG: tRNA(Ile)-lysidine synthase [Planctomycetota bacterium]